ncbi:hypothetical protein [Streptomyces capitiformicae]|uniref:Lipoprotein n=1 Tax=Streptomyces capitiformicae TaxID=2014920 RepID=A0A919GFU4_9ACTN|nr:hypothetical protein [Streptomyces capitiformicae]GHH83206.1 hypothetical protein GCM10017771_09430 [Streptomyces capitiformicae]
MRRTATILIAASLLLAACSNSDDTTNSTPSSTAPTGDEARYDEIWNARSPGMQATVCKLLAADDQKSASTLLRETLDDPSVDLDALAEYINDKKC